MRQSQTVAPSRLISNAQMHWALINKVVEHTGYSDDAIRAKKQRGEWLEGVHWRKGPDNRLVFNLIAIQNWMGGFDA